MAPVQASEPSAEERIQALQGEISALRDLLETRTEDIEVELRRQAEVIDALHATLQGRNQAGDA